MSGARLPIPPAHLASRVGTPEGADPLGFYLQEGAALRERIERFLPLDWSYEGKRVLDFGCGSARVLRHFADEAEHADFRGCDIDGPSIDWINANLSPPLRAFRNDLEPPLALEDARLDLIWATSVFTHIDRWSPWLLELHRVLAPRGLLIATFLGEGMWEALVGEPYPEDEVGMTVLRHWEDGGPGAWVFHSEWWLRAHWGRAFEVLEVARPPRDAHGSAQITHSYIALRKRPVQVTNSELERRDPAELREIAGLQTNIRLLRAEIDALVMDGLPEPGVEAALRRALASSRLGGRLRDARNRLRLARRRL